MTKQCKRLLNHLRTSSINPLQAWVKLGIYRLSARIYELRKAGHEIVMREVKVENGWGEKLMVGEYRLVTEKKG